MVSLKIDEKVTSTSLSTSLSHEDLDNCLWLVDWIKSELLTRGPDWIPNIDDVTNSFSINTDQILLCASMILWIRVARREHLDRQQRNWLPLSIDILKSRLFSRIRSGAKVLAYPPPTNERDPWYGLIDTPDIPHWVHNLNVYKPVDGDAAVVIAGCVYKVETWSDKDETIPFSVSYGPYLFRVFDGPYDTHRYNSKSKTVNPITIHGWWIKYVPNPLEPGAFDASIN